MEEQAAHELYTEFAAVDADARFKQGIGFAGRGAPRELQGWADKDDDDVIARNRRLFGGDRGRQEERGSPDYDSDTAEAVQRRLRALKKEQRPQQAEGPAPLPDRLYDERKEQHQLRHSKPEQPKLKAKTQYLLERSEAKDRKQQERGREEEGTADQQQWTRFRFSDAAELEEHRLQPTAVYGEANEEADDVRAAGLGGLSAVTFKQSNAAAVQQERDDLHSAAIFGGGGGVVVPAAEVAAVLHQPQQPAAAASGGSGGGGGLSWRERALAAKRAKQQQ
ncbi:hypothetical protein C2E21_0575 [Chlorella sorokiniana]|uniref:Uncharacterized protein n=1 Tax=Chlorella sorokiniana TaxID=3076 RepID=A0A2P6U4V2_CHLSO|nr:hypothetical protein C2E21_0575 [Chlorella sorokiniana]|eukprot:PRW61353.1 hypothetical protein C2E21_0575 [Chlorella sorokiniana]